MSTEIRRTKMEVTSDPRLRAGVRAALEHICERHGISENDRHELAASVENECASGASVSGGANCAIVIDEMEDRVEVSVAPAKNSSDKINSREADSPKHQIISQAKENSSGRIFVKRFQKNAAHS